MKKTIENLVVEGENAGKQYFLLLLQCFEPYKDRNSADKVDFWCVDVQSALVVSKSE